MMTTIKIAKEVASKFVISFPVKTKNDIVTVANKGMHENKIEYSGIIREKV